MRWSRRRVLGGLVVVACLICMWNVAHVQPVHVLEVTAGHHHPNSLLHVPSKSSPSKRRSSENWTKKQVTTETLSNDSPTRFLASEHSERLQRQSHRLLTEGSRRLLGLFDSFQRRVASPHSGTTTATDRECSYWASKAQRRDSFRKFDYSHRIKRKGELSTMEMYRSIKRLGGPSAFVEFGATIPPVINQWPVQLSDEFDLTEPFGSWNTRFVKIHDVPVELAAFASEFAHETPLIEGVDEAHGASSLGGSVTAPRHDDGMERSLPPAHRLHLTAVARKRIGKWLAQYHQPQRLERQPPAYVALFANAVVSHGHVVTCGGDVLTAGGCLWDFHLPQMTDGHADVHRENAAISLCDEWCKGYYHFTHEHLPRVAVVHNVLMERRDVKLVLSHSPNRFQLQFLSDVLGIPRDQIIHGKAVLGSTVLYPMPMRCGNTFTTMLYLIRRIVFDRLRLSEGMTLVLDAPRLLTHVASLRTTTTALHGNNFTRYDSSSSRQGEVVADVDAAEASPSAQSRPTKLHLLFAERKHLSRMPTNYFELKKKLVDEFGVVFRFSTTTGDADATSQIRLFHEADVVVGPHGANLANMMWMRHGTHVIEIASRRKGNMCYYATASRINVTHHLVMHDKGKDAKFLLDYEYLRNHVMHAVKAILMHQR